MDVCMLVSVERGTWTRGAQDERRRCAVRTLALKAYTARSNGRPVCISLCSVAHAARVAAERIG